MPSASRAAILLRAGLDSHPMAESPFQRVERDWLGLSAFTLDSGAARPGSL